MEDNKRSFEASKTKESSQNDDVSVKPFIRNTVNYPVHIHMSYTIRTRKNSQVLMDLQLVYYKDVTHRIYICTSNLETIYF